MKTTMKAAILLLTGTILFSQASLADRPGDKPPPKPAPTDCYDFVDLGSVCAYDLSMAHSTLGTYSGSFKSDKDFFGLRCKVVESEVKMFEDKPDDALAKLAKSYDKVWTLVSQRKLEKSAAILIAADIATARDCADPDLPTP